MCTDLDFLRFQSPDALRRRKPVSEGPKGGLSDAKTDHVVTPAAYLVRSGEGKQGFTSVQNWEDTAQTETCGVF